MIKKYTEDRCFNRVFDYYYKKSESLFKYLILASLHGQYLNQSDVFEIESDFYEFLPYNGLVEIDFLAVVRGIEKKNVNVDSLNRIAINFLVGIDYSELKKNYKNVFLHVIEAVVVQGSYEQYGISTEEILKQLVAKKYIDFYDIMPISVARGVVLYERESTHKTTLAYKIKLELFGLLRKILNKNKL